NFRLTAEIPGVPEPHNQRTFQLSPGHCSSENFLTVPFAAIAGTLRDAAGNPVPNQFVSISAIPPTVTPQFPFLRATSAAGEFRFDLLPMGSYTLSINADRPPNQRDWYGNRIPYPRALYPVTLKNGESAENIEFRLPAVPATKTIQGRVTDPGGTPTPALVTLLDPSYPNDKAQVDSVETDAAGAFAVIIQEGRSYLLFAQSQAANRILHSDFVELPPDTPSPLHLSLTHNVQYNQCTACRRYQIWVSPHWKKSNPE
ncbi:MAG: carboxypeptidase-like regulatory domain-containing protein, partial [Bryobacteraceae bacterium]